MSSKIIQNFDNQKHDYSFENLNLITANTKIGTVTASATSTTVTGSGTRFTKANANDIIVLSYSNLHKEVKQITSITNDTSLVIESNTSFIGDGRLTTNSTTSIVVSNATPRIIVNDNISYDVSGVGTVTTVTVNSITNNFDSRGNTLIVVSSAAPSSNADVLYMVSPQISAVSYNIVSSVGETSHAYFSNNITTLTQIINNYRELLYL